jgi:hypothetical protein
MKFTLDPERSMMGQATEKVINDLNKQKASGSTHVTVEIDLMIMLLSSIQELDKRVRDIQTVYDELVGTHDYAKGM